MRCPPLSICDAVVGASRTSSKTLFGLHVSVEDNGVVDGVHNALVGGRGMMTPLNTLSAPTTSEE